MEPKLATLELIAIRGIKSAECSTLLAFATHRDSNGKLKAPDCIPWALAGQFDRNASGISRFEIRH